MWHLVVGGFDWRGALHTDTREGGEVSGSRDINGRFAADNSVEALRQRPLGLLCGLGEDALLGGDDRRFISEDYGRRMLMSILFNLQ